MSSDIYYVIKDKKQNPKSPPLLTEYDAQWESETFMEQYMKVRKIDTKGEIMKQRVERIQHLFQERFGIELKEHELYGYLRPRLIKYMDDFLDKEVSNSEMIQLTDFLTQKLHGKSILPDKIESSPREDLPKKSSKKK